MSCDERGNCVIKAVDGARRLGGFRCVHCGAGFVGIEFVETVR